MVKKVRQRGSEMFVVKWRLCRGGSVGFVLIFLFILGLNRFGMFLRIMSGSLISYLILCPGTVADFFFEMLVRYVFLFSCCSVKCMWKVLYIRNTFFFRHYMSVICCCFKFSSGGYFRTLVFGICVCCYYMSVIRCYYINVIFLWLR